jgi:AcrR family transcriptional regulator
VTTGLTSPRALRTRARILDAALDLFERHGYDATTVTQIATAAGVTPMTFFRHFRSKNAVLVTDPYDPLIAAAVSHQPRELSTLERVRRGFLDALTRITPFEDATARRRVAIVAATPSLRAATVAGNDATQAAIVDQLVADGVARFDASVVTAACLAALAAALLAWAEGDDDATLGELVQRALAQLAPEVAP